MTADNGMEGPLLPDDAAPDATPESGPPMAEPTPERVVLLRTIAEAGQAMTAAGAALQASGTTLAALAALLLRRPSAPAPARPPVASEPEIVFVGGGRAGRSTPSR